MDGSFLDILLFAAIAAFLVFRLRNVLGKRVGRERPDDERNDRLGAGGRGPGTGRGDPDRDKVVHLPDLTGKPDLGIPGLESDPEPEVPAAPGSVKAGIQKIRAADPSFTGEGFVTGARAAFEMIVQAFADGDLKALKPLLSDTVFDQFRQAIKAREAAGQRLETTLVGLDAVDILEADLRDREAIVTLSFKSEQVNVVRDKDGEPVDGDPARVDKVTDIWTFSRNTRSRDPNWTLIATRSPN
jgi:predicted lipid-binding transport protein (Tim44 family)